MESDLWRIAGTTLGILLGVPMLALIVRATMFVGSMKTTVESLGKSFDAMSRALTDLASETRDTLGDHESRLSVLEDRRSHDRGNDHGENRRRP